MTRTTECEADVRGRGGEARLAFGLDLAVCLYPAGSGGPLKGNNSSEFTATVIITLIIPQ